MNPLENCHITCPYCAEPIELLVDCSEAEQSYVEDCAICCRPIHVQVSVADGLIAVDARTENE